MAAIIVMLAILGLIILGAIAMALWLYRDAHEDNEYWELFHDHDHDHEY